MSAKKSSNTSTGNEATPANVEYTRASLIRLTREELDEVALAYNVNPRRYKNKDMLASMVMQSINENAVDPNTNLNEKQELFCQLYATQYEFMGNGTQAYIEAYDVNVSKPGSYKSAATSAYRLLQNVDILKRIDDLVDLQINETSVDKQLGFWIMQRADAGVSVSAIKEWNKLKKRTVEALAGIPSLTQNNYTVNITDERGQYLSKKYEEFMMHVTKRETPAEETQNARSVPPAMVAQLTRKA